MSSRIRRFVSDVRNSIGRFVSADSIATDSAAFTPPVAPRTFSPTQGFGTELIPESEMLFASQREPVIKWLVYWVASDIFDNWFKVIDPEKPEEDALDKAVQPALLELNAKTQLARLIQFERRYGTAVMLCAYTLQDGETWESPVYTETGVLENSPQLLQITPYPWTRVNIKIRDISQSSLRYGWPNFYDIARQGSGISSTEVSVHWTRIIHAATRIDEEVYEGESVVYAIYDDATGFRNARWAQYETLFRYGSGFPHIHLPNATPEQVASWIGAGRFADINARGFFVSTGVGDEAESIEFVGVQDVSLNPDSYNKLSLIMMSMASRIPQDILMGVSAGRITGSEVNERAYFKFINAEQSSVEPIVRELIDRLIDTGQIKYEDNRRGGVDKNYIIEWNYPQLTPEQSQAQINYLNSRAQTERLEYMTIDEVRAKADPPLPPLPDGKGDVCVGVPGEGPVARGGETSPFASNPERRELEKPTDDENSEDEFDDSVLKDALESGQ